MRATVAMLGSKLVRAAAGSRGSSVTFRLMSRGSDCRMRKMVAKQCALRESSALEWDSPEVWLPTFRRQRNETQDRVPYARG